tara:strand:+ start:7064 stop:8686 length:1623 start_codon:yes stop_codon:yes gene_type:complete
MDTGEIFKRFEVLQRMRGTWESHWEEIASRVLPRSAEFVGTRTAGDKRTEKLFDATAALALERFAAAVESLLTPRGARWHTTRSSNTELNKDPEVKAWFEQANAAMFLHRYSPKANFASQMHESYLSLGAFGTAGLFVDEAPVRGLNYRGIHLADLFIADNEHGMIDTVFRRFEVSARQALRMFEDGDLSLDLRKLANDRPDEKVKLLHVVMPRTDRDPERSDRKNQPWFSGYYEIQTKNMIEEGGFTTNPYIVSRYNVGPREIFGRSPAMTILPDIKMLNEMSKTVIRAGQKVVDPPLLIADEGVIYPVNTNPGKATFARLDGRNQPPIQPLYTGARVDIGFDMMEQRRKIINEAFLVNLFAILIESPRMTATEVLQRAQEKGALLAPTIGRQQTELLGPLIEREFDILMRQGLIPPIPGVLVEAQDEYEIEYVSPLTRAMKAEEGIGILRTLEMVQPIAAVDPGVMDNFDMDKITKILADTNGAPQSILRDEAAVGQIRQQRDQAAQMQSMVDNAGPAADAAQKVQEISQSIQQPSPQ